MKFYAYYLLAFVNHLKISKIIFLVDKVGLENCFLKNFTNII